MIKEGSIMGGRKVFARAFKEKVVGLALKTDRKQEVDKIGKEAHERRSEGRGI
ncbi:MAG: hypothetical protein LBB43_06625 [Spirochaetaceae bacterium]|nr:hypothetical protein [Spirochaetaceae bacterium]